MRRFGLILAILVVFAPLAAHAAPKAELWERWAKHDEASTRTVDHSAWAAFLDKYLVRVKNGPNLIRYGQVGAADKTALGTYINMLAATPVSTLKRAEQKAFWINLYNALTVQVILEHYPVKRILDIDISPGFFAVGPWGKKLIKVEGEDISLDDIEHRILRPIWNDPRVHYAVNCASMSCPELQPVPFTAAATDAMLDAAARTYIAGGWGIWFDGGELGASSIYKWYGRDFGNDDEAIIAHFKHYASPALKAKLDTVHEISVYTYDWSLNEAK